MSIIGKYIVDVATRGLQVQAADVLSNAVTGLQKKLFTDPDTTVDEWEQARAASKQGEYSALLIEKKDDKWLDRAAVFDSDNKRKYYIIADFYARKRTISIKDRKGVSLGTANEDMPPFSIHGDTRHTEFQFTFHKRKYVINEDGAQRILQPLGWYTRSKKKQLQVYDKDGKLIAWTNGSLIRKPSTIIYCIDEDTDFLILMLLLVRSSTSFSYNEDFSRYYDRNLNKPHDG